MQQSQRSHKTRGRPDIPKIGRGLPSARAGEPPPPEFLVGIDEFNTGRYYACHETLEALWVVERDPIRYLYQGILQIGVGLYHHSRGNYRGATSLLRRGMGLLPPFTPRSLGVDVEKLLRESQRCYDILVALGPDRMGELDLALLPKVRLVAGAEPSRASDDGEALSR